MASAAPLVEGYGGTRRRVRQLMGAPYGRIVVLHIAVIFGGMGVMALGLPIAMLVALVALKLGSILVCTCVSTGEVPVERVSASVSSGRMRLPARRIRDAAAVTRTLNLTGLNL